MGAWIARLATLFVVPLAIVVAALAWPKLLDQENLRILAGAIVAIGGLFAWLFKQLMDATRIEGLVARERERLREAALRIRVRMWRIAAVCGVAAILLFVVAAARDSFTDLQLAYIVGVLMGIACSYVALVPFWFEELNSFVEEVRERAERRKDLDRAVKDLSGPGAA